MSQRLLALVLLVLTAAGAPEEARYWQLKSQVEQALRSVGGLLNQSRRPQFPADVPHEYEDKFLLAELATKASAAAVASLLESLSGEPGWWQAHEGVLQRWQQKQGVVTLRLAACERCELERTEKKDLDTGTKTVTETLGGWVASTAKTVTTVQEHSWRFNATWELHIFSTAVGEDARIAVRRGSGLYRMKTTTGLNEDAVPPRPESRCDVKADLDISWLLGLLGPQGLDFAVNRSDAAGCKTPRRNKDIAAALRFFGELEAWAGRGTNYFLGALFPVQEPRGKFDLPAIARGAQEAPRPVHSLFALDAAPDGQRPVMTGSFAAVLAEHRRSLDRLLQGMAAIFPAEGGLVTQSAAGVAALLFHARLISQDLSAALDALETMLYRQLAAAVGKHLTSGDFAEYMDFHHGKLFRPELQPGRFSYAVRRPGQSPEGVVSIEAPLPGTGGGKSTLPIQTLAARFEAGRPMHMALSAATDMQFLGERYLHPIVLHRFSAEAPQQLSLVARARQFSSFALLVGRVQSASRFEPTAALIIKDKDDLSLPLLLETVPAPKEFRDAVESLSPEQQRFARAFREMQLASTLFGLLVVQLKPQLEELLSLPSRSLTKEIQLTQDLMELFITYQVPADLLSYDPASDAGNRSALQAVKDHVKAMMDTIEVAKARELQDEKAKAASARLRGMCRGQRCGAEDEEDEDEAAAPSFVDFGSSMALRSFARLGAAIEVQHLALGKKEMMKSKDFLGKAPERAPAEERLRRSEMAPEEAAASSRGDSQREPGSFEGEPDYASLAGLLDRRFELLDTGGTLRPTKITPGPTWKKMESPGLLAPPVERTLRGEEQDREKARAFDLLDALTRSGALPMRHASLHVLLAATHGFDQTLVDSIVQENMNPIEKLERSLLIMTSTLHNKSAEALLAPGQLQRVRAASPALFAEEA